MKTFIQFVASLSIKDFLRSIKRATLVRCDFTIVRADWLEYNGFMIELLGIGTSDFNRALFRINFSSGRFLNVDLAFIRIISWDADYHDFSDY